LIDLPPGLVVGPGGNPFAEAHKMKTKKTRRSLLWGVLLAGFAGTLTAATHPVRAESTTSSALATALGDDTASSTVKPYFWTELAHQAATSSCGLISSDIGALYAYYIATTGSGCTYGVASSAARALPEHALD
jgi:hypothetical protein